ncbi:hypothetical protein [Hoeflea prorocentri]|uniref:Uncharacterized protein n=1 Tax=Hoeflea prorocentri TaxID=1922333 RepID=A0A9X3UKG9_9HYPH|nr:hypothetical protein [Hoeflea prorocentri]MCY6380541.1 hypothetical protein [Hoeflea prorocentri]MDA5398341.1 hypothetical protein [Hoeflea prorocentri]
MSKGRRSAFCKEEVLDKLRVGRDGAMMVCAGAQPFKDRYNKANAILRSIDDLTEDLTGDREYFWVKPHG